jgi:hypothetical protein
VSDVHRCGIHRRKFRWLPWSARHRSVQKLFGMGSRARLRSRSLWCTEFLKA